MNKTKVLIVDDSILIRKQVRNLLESSQKFEVIGVARNGEDALFKLKLIKPDVVIMDIEMNPMNGIEALQNIMKANPIPVIMLSSYTSNGASYTVEALQNGAIECFFKADILSKTSNPQDIKLFFHKIEAASKVKFRKNIEPTSLVQKKIETIIEPIKNEKIKRDFKMLLIGCSTGGPNALQSVLPKIPVDFKHPILVAQHMPKRFTASLAERFNQLCPLPVKEAEHGEVVKGGIIYIAPSGYQTTIRQRKGQNIWFVEDNEKYNNLYSPCVDMSLISLVSIYKKNVLSVIMTGMGNDGQVGCEELKKYGGYVLSQSADSCIVYGMPKAVDKAGLSDEQVDLDEIHERILKLMHK